jgi:DNA-binding CsgD family transcriptional regulator
VGEVAACAPDFDEGRCRRSEPFNDFLAPYGVPYVAGARPFASDRLSAVVAVLRSFRQGPFGATELAVLHRLAPHLGRAVQLQLRLRETASQRTAIEAAVERLPFGVVITDAGGRALVVNGTARDMAAAMDGLLLCGGRLTANDPTAAALLRLIGDLQQRSLVLGRRLVELFGLTPAEARLTVALAAGRQLEEVARERSVRMPTLRTQLRAVLDKTGTRRQAELTALVARLPAVRSGAEPGHH